MMMTFFSASTPSISTRSCGTIVLSMSELMPVPRVRNIESISSKKTMTGQPSSDFSRARWNTSRIWRSVSPTYLLRSSGPLMLKKYDLAVVAAGGGGHLLGEAVGHRLGDERLAAARAGRRGGCPSAPAAGARRRGPGAGTAARPRRRSSRSGRRGRRCPRSRCRAPPRGRGPPPRAGAASRAPGPDRGSSSTVSPLRSFTSRSSSSSSTTRSSSARPTISTRLPSRRSLKVTTSPVSSAPRDSTTLSDSLSTTSAPRAERLVAELGVHRDAHLAAAGEDVDGAVVVVAERACRRPTAAG